jgi:hypothetical protein
VHAQKYSILKIISSADLQQSALMGSEGMIVDSTFFIHLSWAVEIKAISGARAINGEFWYPRDRALGCQRNVIWIRRIKM